MTTVDNENDTNLTNSSTTASLSNSNTNLSNKSSSILSNNAATSLSNSTTNLSTHDAHLSNTKASLNSIPTSIGVLATPSSNKLSKGPRQQDSTHSLDVNITRLSAGSVADLSSKSSAAKTAAHSQSVDAVDTQNSDDQGLIEVRRVQKYFNSSCLIY